METIVIDFSNEGEIKPSEKHTLFIQGHDGSVSETIAKILVSNKT